MVHIKHTIIVVLVMVKIGSERVMLQRGQEGSFGYIMAGLTSTQMLVEVCSSIKSVG